MTDVLLVAAGAAALLLWIVLVFALMDRLTRKRPARPAAAGDGRGRETRRSAARRSTVPPP